MDTLKVICLHEPAFFELIESVVERLKPANDIEPKWVSPERAMELLNIGKTTLQKYRNEGKIRYSQPQRKLIVYDRESIEQYLETNAKNTF